MFQELCESLFDEEAGVIKGWCEKGKKVRRSDCNEGKDARSGLFHEDTCFVAQAHKKTVVYWAWREGLLRDSRGLFLQVISWGLSKEFRLSA